MAHARVRASDCARAGGSTQGRACWYSLGRVTVLPASAPRCCSGLSSRRHCLVLSQAGASSTTPCTVGSQLQPANEVARPRAGRTRTRWGRCSARWRAIQAPRELPTTTWGRPPVSSSSASAASCILQRREQRACAGPAGAHGAPPVPKAVLLQRSAGLPVAPVVKPSAGEASRGTVGLQMPALGPAPRGL